MVSGVVFRSSIIAQMILNHEDEEEEEVKEPKERCRCCDGENDKTFFVQMTAPK